MGMIFFNIHFSYLFPFPSKQAGNFHPLNHTIAKIRLV
jgi:hypothetical protein